MSIERKVAYTFVVLVAISTIASAVSTRGLAHIPFVLEAWAILALVVVAAYQIRKWTAARQNKSV